MMMLTAKLDRKKLIIAALIVVAIVVSFLLPTGGSTTEIGKAETNDERIAFLASFGWDVVPEPVQSQEVLVPVESNEVFERYNELQKYQGYDLSRLSGKCVRRYVYEIKNYPNTDEPFYATVLVYRDKIVGGDVASAAKGGLMHSFEMPKYQSGATT